MRPGRSRARCRSRSRAPAHPRCRGTRRRIARSASSSSISPPPLSSSSPGAPTSPSGVGQLADGGEALEDVARAALVAAAAVELGEPAQHALLLRGLLRALEQRRELLVAVGVAVVELQRALGERDRLGDLAARGEVLPSVGQRAHVALVELEDAAVDAGRPPRRRPAARAPRPRADTPRSRLRCLPSWRSRSATLIRLLVFEGSAFAILRRRSSASLFLPWRW